MATTTALMDDLDQIDTEIAKCETRFDATESGTPENLALIERLDRLEADRRDIKAAIKAALAAK